MTAPLSVNARNSVEIKNNQCCPIFGSSKHRRKSSSPRKSAEKADKKGKEILEKAEFIAASPKGSFAADGSFRPSPLVSPVLEPHMHPEWKPMPANDEVKHTPTYSDILKANEAKEAAKLNQPQIFIFEEEKGGQKFSNLDKLVQERPTQLEGD